MKTNWKNKLKIALEKDKFSEQSLNSALTISDKNLSNKVSSVIVSSNLVDKSEKTINASILNKESNLVLSAFVSSRLMDIPRKFDEFTKTEADKYHPNLNRFIERGCVFAVFANAFHFIDKRQALKLSDLEFLKLNKQDILCQLQQSLLTKQLFTHSPELIEDFAFEIMERESLMTITAETSIGIYYEAVKDTTKKWFNDLLDKCQS